TPPREFPPGLLRPRYAALLADGAGHGAVSAGFVLRGRARFECWLFVRGVEKLDRFTTEPGAVMIGVALAAASTAGGRPASGGSASAGARAGPGRRTAWAGDRA